MGQTQSTDNDTRIRRSSFIGSLRKGKHKAVMSQSVSFPASTDPSIKVDCNTATEEELMTLPGVNRTLAQSITTCRRALHGFDRCEDLVNADGMGADKMNSLLPFITIGNGYNERLDSSSLNGSWLMDNPTMDGTSQTSQISQPRRTKPRVPVNINKCTVEQLRKVRDIPTIVCENIVHKRNRKGNYKNIDSLLKVKGMTKLMLNAVRPYLTTDSDIDSGLGNPPHDDRRDRLAWPNLDDENVPEVVRMYAGTGTRSIGHLRNKSDLGPFNRMDISTSECVAPQSISTVRPLVDNFRFSVDGRPALRAGSWSLESCCDEKIRNQGVLEVICMTILENSLSIVVVQELVSARVLEYICSQLNHPSLPHVLSWSGYLGHWESRSKLIGKNHDGTDCYIGVLYDVARGLQLTDCSSLDVRTSGALHSFTYEPVLFSFSLIEVDEPLLFCSVHLSSEDSNFLSRTDVQLCAIPLLRRFVKVLEDAAPSADAAIVLPIHLEKALTNNGGVNILSSFGYVDQLSDGVRTDISRTQFQGEAKHLHFCLNSPALRRYTGKWSVIRQGLSHPCIPNGWQWGGVASAFCPVFLQFFTDAVERERDNTLKRTDPTSSSSNSSNN